MKSYDYYQRIESYLEGRMDEIALSDFENQLRIDPKLSEDMRNYEAIVSEIEEFSKDELKSNLNKVFDDVIGKNQSLIVFGKIGKVAAVVIILLLFLSPVIYNRYINVDHGDQLFAEYFEPYINVSYVRGSDMDQRNLLSESAMYYYSKRKFDLAVLNFEELMNNSDVKDIEMEFYYGISCLGADKVHKAISIFEDIAYKESVFVEQAKWYQALAYLKIDQDEQAFFLLHELVSSGSTFKNKAQDLIERI